MGRFSSTYDSRVANRIARRKRYRRRRRWRKKSLASKAYIIAKRNARRIPRPELYTYYYLKQIGLLQFASAADKVHSDWWHLSSWHPYGRDETYWSTSGAGAASQPTSLQYIEFRWPPSHLQTGATVVTPNLAFVNQQSGTAIPSNGQNDPISELTSIGQVGTSGTFSGLSHVFKRMRITGYIVMNNAVNTSRTHTDEEMDDVTDANHIVSLRVVVVQHFKQTPDERAISPADVFAVPFNTSNASAQTIQTHPGWIRSSKTRKPRMDGTSTTLGYDDNRASFAAVVTPADNGTIAARTLDFKVLKEYVVQFNSATYADTMRYRRQPVDITVTAAQPRIWWNSKESGTSISAAEFNECMNPIYVWMMPSHARHKQSDNTAVATGCALFHKLNVSATWADDI
jgi:hypothetical protein